MAAERRKGSLGFGVALRGGGEDKEGERPGARGGGARPAPLLPSPWR